MLLLLQERVCGISHTMEISHRKPTNGPPGGNHHAVGSDVNVLIRHIVFGTLCISKYYMDDLSHRKCSCIKGSILALTTGIILYVVRRYLIRSTEGCGRA